MKLFNKLFILSFILILSSCYTQLSTITYSTPNRNVVATTTQYSYPFYTSDVYFNYYNPLRTNLYYFYTPFYFYNPYYSRLIVIVNTDNGNDKPTKPKRTSYTPPANTPIRTSGVNRTNTTTTVRSATPNRTTTTEVRKTQTTQRGTTTTQRSGEVKRSEPSKSSSSEVRRSGSERTETKPQRSNTNGGEVKKREN